MQADAVALLSMSQHMGREVMCRTCKSVDMFSVLTVIPRGAHSFCLPVLCRLLHMSPAQMRLTASRPSGGPASPSLTGSIPASGVAAGGGAATAPPGGLSGVAAADAAIVALRQAIATGLLLLSAQVRQLVEAFVVRRP